MPFDLESWLGARRDALEGYLAPMFGDAWPAAFTTPLRYPLETGGKRIRPALCFAAFEALGAVDPTPVLPAAAALELVHTYSLVHDDLPAMDDDVERRGRPTVHVAFDEETAILVGDALLTEAFAVVVRAPVPAEVRVELVRTLADAAGYRGMIGGQAADVGVGGTVTAIEQIRRVHALKTGRLLRASLRAGGLVAGADASDLETLDRIGAGIGLAFQLIDDIFDHEEDDSAPSVSRHLGVERTRQEAEALVDEAVRLASGFRNPDALIALARFVVTRSH